MWHRKPGKGGGGGGGKDEGKEDEEDIIKFAGKKQSLVKRWKLTGRAHGIYPEAQQVGCQQLSSRPLAQKLS